MENILEQWKPVPGYEGFYEVSDQGRVRSLNRIITTKKDTRKFKGKILSLSPSGQKGYLSVRLSWPDRKKFYVHVLVATTFHGFRPKGMDCCHCNGNHLDNRASNLRWDTRTANMKDAKVHGTLAVGEKQGTSKLNKNAVVQIRQAEGTCIEIAKKFNICPMQVSRIKRKIQWKWF